MSVYESVSYSDKEIDYILKYGANDNKSWQEVADMGDFIIKGLRGEFYPCKPDTFHPKYEEVSE